MKGIWGILLLTLRLNFRARQALVYGYLVPIFFLLAFGSVFHSSVPPLLHEMGQLVTITVLGGACFGMPTSMVSERERGVWRRYRLLPASTAGLIISAMVARYIIVLLAVLMQFGLAWCLYRTPFPAQPLAMLVAFTAVCFAFLGMGLVIAMLAGAVPAVQALGQAIFLPMIMIGGVGRAVAGAAGLGAACGGISCRGGMPSRRWMRVIFPEGPGCAGAKFALAALVVIGDRGMRRGVADVPVGCGAEARPGAKPWIAFALAAWAGVGLVAERTGRLAVPIDARRASARPPAAAAVPTACRRVRVHEGWRISRRRRSTASPSIICRRTTGWLRRWRRAWMIFPPIRRSGSMGSRNARGSGSRGCKADLVQRVRNLLSAAAVFDVLEDPDEGAVGYVVLDYIRQQVPDEELAKV